MVRRLSGYAVLFVTLQVTAGGVNVMLSAPGWMQVVHLLLANLVWLSLVLLSAELGDTATTLDPAAVADV
jgi:heme A synthase